MPRPKTAARRPAAPRLIDVTVVMLDEGYASTAVGPIEVFHSAGRLWNMLAGRREEPRFRVQVASIDGGPVTSICGLKLQPALSIRDVEDDELVEKDHPWASRKPRKRVL